MIPIRYVSSKLSFPMNGAHELKSSETHPQTPSQYHLNKASTILSNERNSNAYFQQKQKNSSKTYLKNTSIFSPHQDMNPYNLNSINMSQLNLNSPSNLNKLNAFSAGISEEKIMTNSCSPHKLKNKRNSFAFLQSHHSIIELYEKDLRFSIKKEQDYLRLLQKDFISINNDDDFEIVKRILMKSDKKKDKNEIMFLKRALEQLDFFQALKENIDDNSYEECFTHLKYESTTKNKILFKFGEQSRKLYLIIRGEIAIFIPNQEIKENNELNSSSPRNSLKSMVSSRRSVETSKNLGDSLLPNHTFVRNFKQGEVFGDGSINMKGERTVSAFSKENCVFATLSSKLLQTYYEKKTSEKINFLRKIPLLKNISLSYIQPLLLHCHELYYKKGNIIFKQGDNPTFFYFVSEGEIELSKTIIKKKITNEEMNKEVESIPDLLSYIKYNEVIDSGSIHVNQNNIECPISIISKGEYFGEKEILSNLPRENKAICKTRIAVLFAFPKEKFLDSLKRLTSINEIIKIFRNKKTWESHSYQRNFITKQKSRKNELISTVKRRKSKSYDYNFDMNGLLTYSNIKPIHDLTVRKNDLKKEDYTKNFLNNIDNLHSKIQQLSIESQILPSDSYLHNSSTRIKKEDNLINLFAPSTASRTDLIVKLEALNQKNQTQHKQRVKTLSSYIEKYDNISKYGTFREDLQENINSAILYKTLKCDKLIPNHEKIRDFSRFFLGIKKKFQNSTLKKVRSKETPIEKSKEVDIIVSQIKEPKPKEREKRFSDDLFNFVGSIKIK